MNESDRPEKYPLTLARLPDCSRSAYTLEETARLVGVSPDRLRSYCSLGLLGSMRETPKVGLSFDNDALYELRRIERYRRTHGFSRRTLKLICSLWRENEELKADLRFLRMR